MQETGASMHCVQAMQPNHAQNLLERDSNFAGLLKTTLLLLLLLQRPLFQDNLGKPVLPINTKNCSLSIVLTATDQKPQKSLKR